MKEEDLIKYKKDLLKQLKQEKFSSYDPKEKKVKTTTSTITEIKNNTLTLKALNNFEKYAEDYTKNLIFSGIDFDTIEITIENEIFVSEFFVRKVSSQYTFIDRMDAAKSLTKEDILPEIVKSKVKFSAKKDGKYIDQRGNFLDLGIMDYNEFTNALTALGYEITPKTFEEILTRATRPNDPSTSAKIKIEFSENKKHKR